MHEMWMKYKRKKKKYDEKLAASQLYKEET
jgi:hypothetical protein